VNFGPVTLEFTKVKDVHPVVSFFKIKFQTNYLRIHGTDFQRLFTI